MAIKRAEAGSIVLITAFIDGEMRQTRPRQFYREAADKKYVRVGIPIGTRLDFYNGIMVRQYGPGGSGMWGHVPRHMCKVTLVRRKIKGKRYRGLLVPAGSEDNGHGGKTHHKESFIPLVSIATTAAIVMRPKK